jgi:phenolic acid decarboxylase
MNQNQALRPKTATVISLNLRQTQIRLFGPVFTPFWVNVVDHLSVAFFRVLFALLFSAARARSIEDPPWRAVASQAQIKFARV